MNWFLEHVGDIVGSLFNVIWGYLCSLIYGFIVVLFNLFTSMTQLDILEQSTINGIYQRITMIMTIVMVFYITFEFVKYVVSPDTIIDKEKGAGNIVKRIIISIVLIAFIPNIFSIAMDLQDKIIKTNVISKVIFGQEDFDYKTAGSNFAGDTFAAFYRVDCDEDCTESDREEAQKRVDDVIDTFKKDMGLYAITKGIVFDNIDGDIQFDGLLAVLFGGFTLYILFLYCMDLGIRYIQLIFLQIIAPIAAISYILPQKDGMLQKWSKQTLTTYVDVFIRIAILYFMLLIVSILSTNLDFFEMTASGQQINIFMHILIIMGLLIFVNKAPKLIEELLPFKSGAASVGFGFSGKSRFEPLGKSISTIKKPFAAATGIATGIGRTAASMKAGKLLSNGLKNEKGIKGKLKRGGTYAVSMAKAGAKGAAAGAKNGRFGEATSAARQSVQKDEALVNKGGSVLGKTFRGGHSQEELTRMKMENENIKAAVKIKAEVMNQADEVKQVKQAKAAWESAKSGGASATEIEHLRSEYKALQKAVITGGTVRTDPQTQKEYIVGANGIRVDFQDQEDRIRFDASANESKRMHKLIETGAIKTTDAKGNEIQIKIKTKVDGVEREIEKNLKDITENELKANFGAVETLLNDRVRTVEESDEYQAAEANASETKGSN